MSNSPKGKKAELLRVLSLVADTIREAPDDEILELAEIEYSDPESTAIEVRDKMLSAIRKFDQQKLLRAKLEYQQSVQQISEQEIDIPDSVEARQALLDSLIAELSGDERASVMAMFRDRTGDSDKDFESLLRHLQQLVKRKPRSRHDE